MSTVPQSHIVDIIQPAAPADDATKPILAAQDVELAAVAAAPPPPADEIAEVDNVSVVDIVDTEKVEEKRVSSVSECCSVEVVLDLESGVVAVPETDVKRDCRICHLSMDITNQDSSPGHSIELGCCCKEDLAAAHMQCAQAWFKIKGNKTCEICGSIAQNVSGVPETDATDQWEAINDGVPVARTAMPLSDARNFWQGHRFLNFLLACMVFAFVISWLFHFNVPS